VGITGWLDAVVQDVHYAVRILIRQKAFAATALLTLALGIGATTAIFSLVSALILRPLPFPHSDRLVQLYGASALVPRRDAVANLGRVRDESRSFEALVGYEVGARFLRDAAGTARVMSVRAEPAFFTMLGVPAAIGRTFQPADPPGVAVLSASFWRERFGGEVSAIGQTIVLDDRPYVILGVMPEWFQFPYRAASLLPGARSQSRTEVWIPFDPPLPARARLGNVTGRLKANVPIAAAELELHAIAERMTADGTAGNLRGYSLEPLPQVVVSPAVRRLLFLLFAGVGGVLALACANVTNLSLARMTIRGREVAVRSAVGAARSRLIRQFFTESLVLSLAGGFLGLTLAWSAVRWILLAAGGFIPRAHEVSVDWRVFAFLLTTCTGAAVLSGVAPALAAAQSDGRAVLQSSASGATMSRRQRRVRDSLVVAEVAVAFVLAVAATMLVREWVRLRQTDTGMTTANVVTFHVGQPRALISDPRTFYDIVERVVRLPGVRAAGFAQMLPLQSWGWASNSSDFTVIGRAPVTPVFPIELRYITPGYFDALGIRVVRGRGFTSTDDRAAPNAIIINETLARRYFGQEDPVGRRANRGTIVGVIGDVRQVHLDRAALPEIYFPIAQNWSQISDLGMTLVVSTAGAPEGVVDAVRRAIRDTNPQASIFEVKTMERVIADSLSDFTWYLSLVTLFAVVALVLAVTGTYGVIAYVATSRTREFAIRVALGADRFHITRVVLGHAVRLTAVGLALGVPGALALGLLVRDLPVTIRPPAAPATAAVAVLIGMIAVFACLVPARRAAVADPARALRSE
jgi:predicted permease